MMRRGANLPSIGEFNQSVVLDAIRLSPGGVSRVEIAAQTGLSSQTVTNVARRLIAAGLIREGERLASGPGKPRTSMHLVPGARTAIGIHLDPSFITYTVVDLAGSVIARASTATPRVVSPDDVIESMARSVDALVDDAGIDRGQLLGIGIAAPGPLDLEAGTVNNPPLLDGWDDVALRDALGRALDLPAILEKDVTSATVGELWSSHDADRDDFAVFYLGTGVGLGLALDHSVRRGATSNLGDIGHVRVSDRGAICRCGNSGCLGDNIAPARLVRAAAERGVIALPDLSDHVSVAQAYAAVGEAARRDERAHTLVAEMAADIATAVVTIANMLDLSDIVFSGAFWNHISDVALPEIRRRVGDSRAYMLPHALRVSTSSLGADATAVGAGCQVLSSAFAPSDAQLVPRALA
ncbi:ROK family protein [Microbacterium betulae]|uniref:ROK family protein n=1 Tax=Microbacterium betulae TaxID=2981139 RepID=A0AA97FGN5_9MICO|nr:ROK family protein [Microbacterium sp. AB]WOF23126.1 ROK family protein [Microbacterium sp. AB]